MAAKLALAALISLGLALVGVATVQVAGAESATSAAGAALSADCAGSLGPEATSRCEGAERGGHLAWNAASWLIGLALVVAIGRRSGTPADGSAN
jgi:hypothetical protein